ncbi:MAG: hypothetical protein ACE5K0_09445 [Candidatus Methanofastidiosia archaeon]
MEKRERWLWYLWFIFLALTTYSPIVAPYNKTEPVIFGFSFTLFWWMVLTLILLFSVIVFASRIWRRKNE